MKKYILKYGMLAVLSTATLTSCSNDFIETEFFQQVQQGPLNTIEEMDAFVKGQYLSMRNAAYYGCDFLMIGEARSNNMYSDFANGAGYYQTVASYSMTANDQYATNPYMEMYKVIAKANIVINNVPSGPLTWKASQDPTAIQTRANFLKGQSYASRALALFDLLRMFGQEYAGGTTGVVVPTVYDPEAKQARSTVAETRAQIEADFDKALSLMGAASSAATTNRTEMNVYTVKALMSRYYLYKGDFARVRTLVAEIVAGNKYSVIPAADFSASFSKPNSAVNSIFEIAVGSTNDLGTTSISNKLNLAPNGYGNMKVLPALRLSYIADDVRGSVISSANVLNGKYVNGFDNIHILRYEEVLLNGAEAELNGGSAATALTYYNLIQSKRGKATGALAPAAAVTLDMVATERQKELVGEGFGYWDLLRRNQPVIQRSSSGAAGTIRNVGNQLLTFPIPRTEINVPGTPVTPNPGFGA
ncbi:RagB/SusD family nutrient uptake outer membrane protein [Chryseobacterium carnipullorum]|uniref:SusD family n=2 Tax=Chryseobacterium carnipullorum TaxID=1124835 RepID=A0A376EKN0_CHRCU|nr:RagB/SusD family nutrient uptake outer membrane protein [Chryseobacterium carnipullorum]AZA47460.1 RagB/SusD family nutrient uptake outer membrane protein [Chryseobacterium carnipullorum]AZA66798.1 RagB/SusD family nutrient uptake outer membrane protein [Chryseobacterium carnipullorum]STD10048.1 SusD family [Chryseobacterium carnipullorum]